MPEFCHLHCHTHYSLLDGAADAKKLIARASELGQPAVAITDHGNMFGVPQFYLGARKAGIQPIIGCEFYVTPSGMADKTDRTRYHQVLLAKDEVGYRNLIKLSSLSYTDGFYYKPRLDREALKKYSEGLIATTCCLQSEVQQTILKVGEAEAEQVFKDYLDIFGDDYYVEIQDHAIGDQRRTNVVMARFADKYNVPIIATNDVHYVNEEDHAAQDVMLCLQTGSDYHDPDRMRFDGTQFFLKSAGEMQEAFSYGGLDAKLVDRALDTTLEVADKCKLELEMGKLLMPHFPIPDGMGGPDDYLRHLAYIGAKPRYGEISEVVRERLDFELSVIKQMGYAGYFLIVQDFTTAARELGVSVGPGRGSAAGSAVAYCLGITNVDPLPYDLLFERFLNPERVSMPDIDIDFDDRGRGKVIDYVVDKYGRQNVCQIITFGTMGAKTVIRDVSRVLGVPLQEADRIAKLIPDGVKVSLADAMKASDEFSNLVHSPDTSIKKLMQFAQVLEGSARHTGVHAAGVIIAPGDVSEYVPISMSKSKGEQVITTQYDGSVIEDFGLLKMDFLGLKTLGVLKDALELIKQNHGVDIDLDTLPLDDAHTFELYQRADTVATFQFESSGMREYLIKLKPTEFNDLVAMNALYRPGPMKFIPNYIDRKHGKEEVSYPHEMLRGILEPTYGIPVYQEQVMQMAQVMGGFSLGGADLLRRAMGKKDMAKMAKQRIVFIDGAGEKGVDEKTATKVFDIMAEFALYGFNKSHSVAYSLVAYHTGYLKAHYPAEYMAAAMTNEMGNTERLAIVLEEARHLDIELLPPCLNASEARFTTEDGKIRFGVGAIKGVGLAAIDHLVEKREADGPFDTIYNLTSRVDLRIMGKKAIEGMIQSGAADALEGHRAQLCEALSDAVSYGQKVQRDKLAGQNSLFGGGPQAESMEPTLPHVEVWSRGETLKHERNLLGFYVSGHPLDAFRLEAETFRTMQISDVEASDEDEQPRQWGSKDSAPTQRICGIITAIMHRTTRSGKPIVFATVEDYTGQAEMVLFAREFDRLQHYIKVDEVVLVTGTTEMRGGAVSIKAQDVMPMWKAREQFVKSIVIRLDLDRAGAAIVPQLADLCEENRGMVKLYFDLVGAEFPQPARMRVRKFVVDPTPQLMQGLTRLVGRPNISLLDSATA